MARMAEYLVYGMAQSGNAYKVALMLQLAGADWQPRWVDYFNGETRTPEFRANINEMGEVPVLVHGDRRLTQSGAILDYLTTTLGQFGWNGEDERREILRWLLWDNHKLTSYTATHRFLRTFTTNTPEPVLKVFEGRSRAALATLDAHLQRTPWIACGRTTIADLSACGYLFFEDELGFDITRDYPRIAEWLGRIRALPGWQHPYDLLPGFPLSGTKA
jgi:glutathione S-transferase